MQNNKKTWFLQDSEAKHKQHPDTFWIPPRSDRKWLKPGDIVKVVFNDVEDDMRGERMWVEIVRVANNEYIGALRNDPFVFKDLAFDDEIIFGPEHIIEIK